MRKYLIVVVFVFLACGDGKIPMPTDPLIELHAVHVNDRPVVDGVADDKVWDKAQRFVVHIERETNEGLDEFNIIFKAVWWSDWTKGKTEWEEASFLAIMVEWPDDEKNILKNPWTFNPSDSTWTRGEEMSDWLLLQWFGLSEYNDIWFWDAALTNPMGYAEDQKLLISVIDDSTSKSSLWIDGLSYGNDTDDSQNTWDLNYDDNLTPRDSTDDRPKWAWTHDVKTQPPSLPRIFSDEQERYSCLLYKDVDFLSKTAYAGGDESVKIPGFLLEEPRHDPADVMAAGKWENGTWTLEMVRAASTGNPNDITFLTDDRYFTQTLFVALGDNQATPFEKMDGDAIYFGYDPVVLTFEFIPPRSGF